MRAVLQRVTRANVSVAGETVGAIGKGLVVLGIDAQDFDFDARRFVDRYGLTYPILRDKHGSTLGHYGISGFPETWFVDRRGRLVGKHIEGPVSGAELERYVQVALQS